MPYCRNCGDEVSSQTVICPKCGSQLKTLQRQNTPIIDNGKTGWGLLAFCFPIVGLVLYLIWKTDRPITSKLLLKGTIIGFIFMLIYYIFYLSFFLSNLELFF